MSCICAVSKGTKTKYVMENGGDFYWENFNNTEIRNPSDERYMETLLFSKAKVIIFFITGMS